MSTKLEGIIHHFHQHPIRYTIAAVILLLLIIIAVPRYEDIVNSMKEFYSKPEFKQDMIQIALTFVGAALGAFLSLALSQADNKSQLQTLFYGELESLLDDHPAPNDRSAAIRNRLSDTHESIRKALNTLDGCHNTFELLYPSGQNIIALANKIREMGIEEVYNTRKEAFYSHGLINYLPVFERASRRFFMGAITLNTAHRCFLDTEAGISLREKLKNENFQFRIITADPFDAHQMESVKDADIERGEPKKETEEALAFFYSMVAASPHDRKSDVKVSPYLPSHFFLLADDELFLQNYMDGEQSTDSVTIKLRKLPGVDNDTFSRYEKKIESHFKRGKPWFEKKDRQGAANQAEIKNAIQ